MSVWVVDVQEEVDQSFRKIVEKKYGPGEQAVEIVLNALMKEWVGRQGKENPRYQHNLLLLLFV